MTASSKPNKPSVPLVAETTRTTKKPDPKKAKTKTNDKKPKLVHDSYSLPKDEHTALGALKRRVAALGLPVKKNHLLRAGLLTLGKLGDAALLEALRALPEPSRVAASTAAPQAAKAKAPKTRAVKAKTPKPVKADKAGKTKKAAKPTLSVPPSDATQAP